MILSGKKWFKKQLFHEIGRKICFIKMREWEKTEKEENEKEEEKKMNENNNNMVKI